MQFDELPLEEQSRILSEARATRNYLANPTPPSALDFQVGGDHYKKSTIQPIEYIHANGLNFSEGSIVKYITRWRSKGGVKDLEKIKHYVDLLIEMEKKYGSQVNLVQE